MTGNLLDKLEHVRAIVRGAGSVLVAYSGGVDSALVLALAREQLHDRALACIGASPSYPRRELRAAVDVARRLGARWRLVRTREYLDPRYLANAPDRCFFCKSELYERLARIASDEGYAAITNGTHADDVGDHAGGMAAADRWGVRSPLLEAGLTKPQVRALARHVDLSVWDKPASPCLASRVGHGTAITTAMLRRIERAEDVLVELSFDRFRVRYEGSLARIELPPADFGRAIACRDLLVCGIRAAGFTRVTLDLAGLREGLTDEPCQLLELGLPPRQ